MPTVLGDETALVQLFQNLIANGLKFHGAQSALVHVQAQQQEGGWQVAVADNGIGIKPEDQDKIFDAFTHLHSQGAYEGSGIGPATCKKIVKQHRGRIWVESVLNQGTTFHCLLPGADTVAPQAA